MDNSAIKQILQTVLDNIENKDNSRYKFYEFEILVDTDRVSYQVKKGSITIRKKRAIFDYVGRINSEVARLSDCSSLYNSIMVKFRSLEDKYAEDCRKEDALKEINKIAKRINR